jgi:hypothetical protein
MTKELEAFDYLMKGDYEKSAFDLPEYDLVRKVLTPPTADEVCKAIKEDTELDVVYIPESPGSSELEFRLKNTFSLICKVFDKRISIYYMLTPRTLSLIGRFYESEEKK